MLRSVLSLCLVLGCLATGCGGKELCVEVCEDLKPRLEDLLPDAGVDCSDPVWKGPDSCDECYALLQDLYDVAVTDWEGYCAEF